MRKLVLFIGIIISLVTSPEVAFSDMPNRFSGQVIAPSFNATGATPSTIPYWDGSKNLSSSATTSLLPEGSNLYYTDARARAAILGSSNTFSLDNTFAGNVFLSGTSNYLSLESLNSITVEILNDGSTGTTLNYLAKINSAGNAVLTATSDTSGATGIVISGAGASGKAEITQMGLAVCAFDGSTTIGDYVQISSTAAGKCHDAGSSSPATGQIIGRAMVTGSGAASRLVLLAAGGGGSGSTLQVQGQSEGSSHAATTLETPRNQMTQIGTSSYLVETGNDNALANPGFEASSIASPWTATKLSGTTFTAAVDASNQKKGSQSALLTWTSATGEFCQTTTSIAQTNGMAMVSAMWVKSALTDVSVCANVGGVDIQCNTYSGAGNWQMVPVTYTGPSNGTAVGVCVKNTNSETGTANADEAFVGSIQSPQGALGQVSQAQLWSREVITGASSWSITQAAYTSDFSATGSPTYTVSGNCSAPGTNVPQIVCNNMPAGNYYIIARGAFNQTTGASGDVGYFRFSDGTTNSEEQAVGQGAASSIYVPLITGFLSYSTAGNRTIKIQCRSDQASASSCSVNAVTSTTIEIYKFPSSSELGYRPDILPASWSGYSSGISGGCSTSSTTYADPSSCTGIGVTQISSENLTCVQAASSAPAITCTFNKTGRYRVSGAVNVTFSSTGRASARIVDGSGALVANGVSVSSAGTGASEGAPFDGMYNVTATGAVTFKAQIAYNNGTANIDQGAVSTQAAITWNVEAAGQGTNSPLLMGSVTSTSTGQEHIERASVPSACGSITSESGSWLSSPSHPRTGNCTFTIATGEFSSAPQCWCTVYSQTGAGLGGRTCEIGTSTSSTVLEVGTSNNAGTLTDYAFNVFCMGPH